MKIKFILFQLLLASFYNISLFAQDTAFSRSVMDTLCSKHFSGRGYIDSGDTRAAKYIVKQFVKAGLKPGVKGKYFVQSFQLDVNTFPGKTDVIIKYDKFPQSKLIPGEDFIVSPNSGGGNLVNLKVFYADSAALNKIVHGKKVKYPKKAFALFFYESELKKIRIKGNIRQILIETKASAIIELKEGRLVWSVGKSALPKPYIEVRKNALNGRPISISINIDQKLQAGYETQNIIGQLISPKNPDSFVVFSAHYDHLGMMGKDAIFPGANDNASGTAMLIDLARSYASAGDTHKYSLLFIAFGAEEAGLIGSHYYTDMPTVPLENIKFVINMDLMGNGQDGMMAVNGSVFTTEYNTLVSINKKNSFLKEIKARGKAANSDHYWFTENGVKAFFFYLLGDYPYYHDVYDTAEKPNLKGYNGAFRLIKSFVKTI